VGTMTVEPAGPVAARLRRPSWRDPRLLAGLVMVAASVSLGSWAVSSAQASTAVYAARGALTPGEPVSGADLVVALVRLDAAQASHYLTVADGPPDGLVALRTVGAGELVPRSAVGAASALEVRPVPVTVADAPSAGVVEGALVDLWATSRDMNGDVVGQPALLAAGLEVAEVARPTGAFAVGGETTIHVLVPERQLPEVLGALATKGSVQVVLVPGTGG